MFDPFLDIVGKCINCVYDSTKIYNEGLDIPLLTGVKRTKLKSMFGIYDLNKKKTKTEVLLIYVEI